MQEICIITINYNNKNGLLRTIESMKKIKKNHEWIVIDGNSTDGSSDIIKNCKYIDKYVIENDEGISDAWNKGIALSTRKYIAILNSGDTYYENYDESVKDFLQEDKILCFDANIINEQDIVGIFKAEPEKLNKGMYLPHNMCIFPKKIYDYFGQYKKIKYSMDYDYFYRVYKHDPKLFVKKNVIIGDYYLGGVSDVEYKKSFKQNKIIQIENGENYILCNINYFISVIKHYLRSFYI